MLNHVGLINDFVSVAKKVSRPLGVGRLVSKRGRFVVLSSRHCTVKSWHLVQDFQGPL